MKRLLFLLWILSLGVLVVQLISALEDLPARVASHFDVQGRPDSWTSRSTFLVSWLSVIVFVNIWPVLLGPLMRKLPPRFINTPNSEYWLATAERREDLIKITQDMIAGVLAGTNVVLYLVFLHTYEFNTTGSSEVNIWLGVGFELIFSLAVIVWGLLKLSRVPEGPAAS